MAPWQSDFSRTYASGQAQAPAPAIRPRSPDATEASAERAEGSGPAIEGPPDVFPAGARTGRPGRPRPRYAWLYDDEDIWGADGADRIPPAVDGDDWRAPRV